MARLPNASELFGGDPAACTGDATPDAPFGRVKPGKAAERHEQLAKAMTAAVAEGISGGVAMIPTETGTPLIKSRKSHQREMDASFGGSLSKGLNDTSTARLAEFLSGPSATTLAKEWSLTT